MTHASRAICIAVVMMACRRDDTPLERLPAPRLIDADTSPPPPPPPPPKGGSPIGPPQEVAVFLAAQAHREAPCRVSITALPSKRTRQLTADRAAAFLERLARHDSWVDGITGCVSSGYDVKIVCDHDERLALWTSCANVELASRGIGTWSDAMDAWFAALRGELFSE